MRKLALVLLTILLTSYNVERGQWITYTSVFDGREVTYYDPIERATEKAFNRPWEKHYNDYGQPYYATYHVATNGTSGGAGTIGDPKSLAWAVANAAAGDIVYIKAGNYGDANLFFPNSGTSGSPIQFIGYKTTPGDITANEGSTFEIGDTVSATEMPLLDGGPFASTSQSDQRANGTGLYIAGQHVQISNIQLYRYWRGIYITGDNFKLDNVIAVDMGHQDSGGYGSGGDGYEGFTASISADNGEIVNCYAENATAEGWKIHNGNNNKIHWTTYFADNANNPTDYYFLISGGGTSGTDIFSDGNIVENCVARRTPGLPHGGHGFDAKGSVRNTQFLNCTTYYTNLEAQFGTCYDNKWEDIRMYGQGKGYANWHTNIRIENGANHLLFNRIYCTGGGDVFVSTGDTNDGYTPNPDTDLVAGGSDIVLSNMIVEDFQTAMQTINSGAGGNARAVSQDFEFINCNFHNVDRFATFRGPNSGFELINSSFTNSLGSTFSGSTGGYPNSLVVTYTNFYNCNFSTPSGTGNTAVNPLYVGGAGAAGYELQSSSPLINSGTTTSVTTDFNGDARIAPFDKGAFEYQGGSSDTTPPSVASYTIDNITDTSFRVDWTLTEPSKGWIEYGISTATYTEETTRENNYYSRHIQTVGGNNAPLLTPGTKYYFVIHTEDATGNATYSAEYTATTLGEAPEPDPDPIIAGGVKSQLLKAKKTGL